jgi:phosphoadenosine phosphosulfate reductase
MVEFLQDGAAYISLSWGKDSLVVAHIAICAGLEIPFLHIKIEPNGNPDNAAVKQIFLDRFDCQYYEFPYQWDWDGRYWFDPKPYSAAIAAANTLKLPSRYITGIRSEESQKRRLRGGKNTVNSCAPIAGWKLRDVFAYLSIHNLPIHPVYAMTNGGLFDRSHLRVECIGGVEGTNFDRREWEELYYRDILYANHPST